MKTVIIGGVAGGAGCAARLRRLDGAREIVMLERGPYISYANCGLPYFAGDVIRQKSALLLMTPERMKERFDIDVRTNSEVTAIHRDRKTVTVKDLSSGTEYEEAYDDLVLATGSSPLRPPIPGIDSPRIRTLWTVTDSEEIKALVKEESVRRAAVIGGGFIGLEMAENLSRAGLAVSVIEAADQVMAPLDYEMAQLLHGELRDKGVDLRLGDPVASFEEAGGSVTVHMKSGASVTAELVILSIGVRPNSSLAREAGLEFNERGGVRVNDHMRTSDPSIYAVGDVAETEDFVFKTPAMVPLAGPANKQARILANVLAGREDRYEGTQGSSVARVFDLTAASTGANEKALKSRGLKKGGDYESLIITQNSHAGYYPGAEPMTIKLLFAPDTGRIYGAQIVGSGGVDKRIDVLATALRLGATVKDLKSLELAYAPPFSSAKDPVNMAGFVAENLLSGLARIADWDAPSARPEALLLDVREPAETQARPIPGSLQIPLGQLRTRLQELDRDREYIVFCAVGVRAYNAARILAHNGFDKVWVYPGGARFYLATHPELSREAPADPPAAAPEAAPAPAQTPAAAPSARLDCCGMQCPGPVMEVYRAMTALKDGETLEVTASDPGFAKDIVSWCRSTGNTLVSNEKKDGEYTAVIRKGAAPAADPEKAPDNKGKTIIVFDGDMDKVLAAFVIANGALAMGRPVTMFFTFWGLTALRKPESAPVKKDLMGRLFGMMLPKGAARLGLSKMNMAGMGSAMMRGVMKDKKIDSLEEMMQKAIQGGARLIACSMSMDVMGIRPEELIDGVEIGGVGAYLGAAEEADTNLFI
ncbi:MAG: FAD-dependent oxidoreductase [Abditibacteriota bacterium]|nr:FAD-dependent oxidoreductase [Abditibacteriota bacterium]